MCKIMQDSANESCIYFIEENYYCFGAESNRKKKAHIRQNVQDADFSNVSIICDAGLFSFCQCRMQSGDI